MGNISYNQPNQGTNPKEITTDGSSEKRRSGSKNSTESFNIVTKQKCDEFLYLLRGTKDNTPFWQYMLVRCQSLKNLRRNSNQELSNIQEYGRIVEYKDATGTIHEASGNGVRPPANLRQWLDDNYDPSSIDHNISLTYDKDDIRLCTMNSDSKNVLLGFFLNYHRHEGFHYLMMNSDETHTLAYRSGLQSCDRIIEFNAVNIEKYTKEELQRELDSLNKQPLQLLVCSPATYLHYKEQRLEINNHLKTVQVCYPVMEDNDSATFQTAFSMTTNKSVNQQLLDKVASEIPLVNSSSDENDQFFTLIEEKNPEKLVPNKSDLVRCQSCGTTRILKERYRCLECVSYDLCGTCFEQRCETHTHDANHAMVRFSGPNEVFSEQVLDVDQMITLKFFKEKFSQEIHANIECKICRMSPIVGLRFKCDICHDYDVCLQCMEQRSHHPSHTLLLTKETKCHEIPVNDIQLGEELGRGGFATVYKSKWISKDRIVACKVIRTSDGMDYVRQSFQKEVSAYAELSGPYIIRTYGFYKQKLPNGHENHGLIMEFMQRGSLTAVLREKTPLSLRLKFDIAFQIVSGMRKIHTHKMIHRDIRPDNILINDDYTAKIGDMGLARLHVPMDKMTMIGCLPYMPPEFYVGKFSQSSDVFMFGITLNELFTGKKHQWEIATHLITLEERSPILSDLIERCTDLQPEHRPTAVQIEMILRFHKQAFEQHLRENKINFTSLQFEEKNRLFLEVYNHFHPSIYKNSISLPQ